MDKNPIITCAEKQANLEEQETLGIKQMRALNKKFLESGDGSSAVREYLTKAGEDDALLLRNLRGRKHRPLHAWETIKCYAEVKFDKYPEAFPVIVPTHVLPLVDSRVLGILKNRDDQGRLVCYYIASAWDPEKYSLEHLLIVTTRLVERALSLEDVVKNGMVFVEECGGMGLKHVKQYTLTEVLRFLNVFWYAYPMKIKGIYIVNVPLIFSFFSGIIKAFFPKKLKERICIWYTGSKFDALHERISPEILPKCLGGNLENDEAVDPFLFRID